MAGPSSKVQIRYDDLESVAQRFAAMTDQTGELRSRLLGQIDVLKSGAWIGAGASYFYQEMDHLMLPALDRLEDVLSNTSAVVQRAADTFADAEQQAAALFKAQGGGIGTGGGTGGNNGGGAGTGGGTSGGGTDNAALKGGLKFVTKRLIMNPTLISNLARMFAGEGADDLVNLARKLKIESGLAIGSRFVAGGAGGLIDFLFLPPGEQNAESFGVQLSSGLIQGAIMLNPVGAVATTVSGGAQLVGSAAIWGAGQISEQFGVDTSGFVNVVSTAKDVLNLDKHVDTVVQGVVDGAQSLIDSIF